WNDARRIFARYVVAPRDETTLEATLVASLSDASGTKRRELLRQKISVGKAEHVDKTFDLRIEDVEPGKSTVRLSVEGTDGTLLAKPFVFTPRAIKSVSFLEDENVSLLDGLFKKAQDDNARNLLQMDIDRLCAGHRLAAGLPEKAKRYGGWESWDSCGFGIGHWLSAACLMYRKTGDENYANKIRRAVDELAQTRRPSGFIGGISEDDVVANIFDRPDTFNVNSYQLGGIWDCWYGVQKVYKGLVEVYQTFGDPRALELACGFADWAKTQTDKFNYAQTQRMLTCEHGAVSETSLWLYDVTNNSDYLELAKRFLRDDLLDPLSEGRDNLTGRHVNEQIPEIQNAATFYEFSGDEKYRRAAEFFWKTCRENRMYANSGMGMAEHYPAIDKEPLASSNTETCCNYNMMKLTETLFSWEHRSQYADYLEESLFNLIYPSQDQGNSEGFGKVYFASFIPGSYRTFSTRDDSFWCCYLTGMESPARLDKSIYYKDGDALYVNLFVPSTARWTEKGLSLMQETRFPYESSSKITIASGEANCALRIRKPRWLAGETTVAVNGERVATTQTDEGYVEIRRLWQTGDVLEIETPMKLNVYRSREGTIAFKYGPILLAAVLDEVDDAERYTTNNNKLGAFKGIDVPELTLDVDRPDDYIEPLNRDRLEFRLNSNATDDGSSFVLRPFFELNRNRYIVYWNLKEE
ncbi:MAG: glycoside hydrolase family 127 protein, partial [Thermoguttaceae bacterium]|nr:glycoside hydrolase family 127 protein [Thermoguttaceae bacterium]